MKKIDPQQLQEFLALYPNTLSRDLAIKFNVSIHTIYNTANYHGLKKDRSFIAENAKYNSMLPNHGGMQTRFKKGLNPPNKGKKQIEYMSPEGIQKSAVTRFKKGQKVWNHKDVGYERINVDGYVEIKVAEPNKFRLKQRVVYEQHFGAIPPGHNVQFKDGIRTNCNDPDNLYLISRSRQLKEQNSMYARYPVEIQNNIHAISNLTRKINKLKKETNDQE